MGHSIFDGSQVNFLIAFLAGITTFFASCLLPLVPTYLAYLSGITLNDEHASQKKWQVFKTGLMFVIGFIITFMILGLTANKFASVLHPYRQFIEKVAGVLFIALGFFMMGIFKNNLLSREKRFNVQGKFKKHRSLHAILTGIAFGFGWTPCIGPVLAVILFWAAQADSALKGTMLLTSYGVGLGVPFLIIALGFEKIIPWIKKHHQISRITSFISGLFILITGILLFTDQLQALSFYLLNFFNLSALST
ncbi:MAG: cytochrome c biogenesis protein CcdA [Candidatus Pacebacteria bacterium]|jgi:cytochrome c-type biogenesis protein|nr:cytochrome c biogenesis protein CcdA [Candidatus Paceibacterota bacterium]MBT4004968.1 cytochrome c biogenesis protein CcdA [Candidatus Paceibacterota bacterium]MBT4358744.1 cytochrome c biogenesis protein CcdA [Candidatus Paceibacterota bacterium]MBT4680921.1 cytochrome c biogenesis protein CcdA [Candidatus Paceibacterota bacterium]MBT6898514.1 cytochrome c biogenesis protein CcdA [Candidatus Paceibacterota bacterium]